MRTVSKGSLMHFCESGNIVGVTTGSDYFSEHENGIEPLLSMLCGSFETVRDASNRYKLHSTPSLKKASFSLFKKPDKFIYPDVVESKRISRVKSDIHFNIKKNKGIEEARLLVSLHGSCFDDIDFYFSGSEDCAIRSAWDENSFIICVRGEKYIKALTSFSMKIMAGDVVFAGSWFKRGGVDISGIVLVDINHLSKEDKIRIDKKQDEVNSLIRLYAKANEIKLRVQMQRVSNCEKAIGFLSPEWKDMQESEVVWMLTPFHQVNAAQGGPYAESELIAWASTGYKSRLSKTI